MKVEREMRIKQQELEKETLKQKLDMERANRRRQFEQQQLNQRHDPRNIIGTNNEQPRHRDGGIQVGDMGTDVDGLQTWRYLQRELTSEERRQELQNILDEFGTVSNASNDHMANRHNEGDNRQFLEGRHSDNDQHIHDQHPSIYMNNRQQQYDRREMEISKRQEELEKREQERKEREHERLERQKEMERLEAERKRQMEFRQTWLQSVPENNAGLLQRHLDKRRMIDEYRKAENAMESRRREMNRYYYRRRYRRSAIGAIDTPFVNLVIDGDDHNEANTLTDDQLDYFNLLFLPDFSFKGKVSLNSYVII